MDWLEINLITLTAISFLLLLYCITLSVRMHRTNKELNRLKNQYMWRIENEQTRR